MDGWINKISKLINHNFYPNTDQLKRQLYLINIYHFQQK